MPPPALAEFEAMVQWRTSRYGPWEKMPPPW